MTTSETEELLAFLAQLSDVCEDLTQRVVAFENCQYDADRQRYERELKKLKARGGLTNASTALEALRKKLTSA